MAHVLVIEPDRQIREFVAGILIDFGHRVQQCDDAGEARQWLRRETFDAVATDPGSGCEAGEIAALTGLLPVLTLSGQALRTTAEFHEQPARLRDKPFRFDDLRGLVTAVTACEAAGALAG